MSSPTKCKHTWERRPDADGYHAITYQCSACSRWGSNWRAGIRERPKAWSPAAVSTRWPSQVPRKTIAKDDIEAYEPPSHWRGTL